MGNRFSTFATLAVLGAALFAVGCGRYDPDAAEYPKNYDAVPPPPPATQEELAAQQQQRAEEGETEARSPEVAIGADQNEYADTDPSALTEFKPALDNHGAWVDDSTYGTVWVPSSSEVGADFQPYVTAGHWTYSDDTDYVWVSDYEWGWAPFHYGRWVYLPEGRWGWIAGRRYSGAWVTWRTGPSGYGYVGWAPMAPDYYWASGFAVGWTFGFYHPYDYYVYCPHEHFYGPVVGTYVVRGPAAHEYYGRTHDYIPASPGVGGRVPANPSVGGAGTGRVVATPSVGGVHGAGSGAVASRGPRPDELGMKHDVVVPPPAAHQGLTRAQAMATPASSIAHGGSVPMQAPHTTTAFADCPASTAYVPRSSFAAHAATSSSRPRPTEAYRGSSPSVSPSHVATTSAPAYRPRTTSAFRSSSPSVSAPRVSAAPSTHVSRAPSSFRASSPSVSRPSAPAMRAAPSSAFRSAAPSVTHSAPAAASRPAAVRSGSSGKRR